MAAVHLTFLPSSGWGSLPRELGLDRAHLSHVCIRPLCPQLRQLELQLEQEYEEKQIALHEKQDLEGLIGTLCDQVRGKHPQTKRV